MSNLTPEQLDTLSRAVPDLAPQLNALKVKQSNGFGAKLKKFGASLVAAFSTPEAIKAEKSLVVVALTRAAILVPSAAVLIDLLVKALGGPAVSP